MSVVRNNTWIRAPNSATLESFRLNHLRTSQLLGKAPPAPKGCSLFRIPFLVFLWRYLSQY
jgi:hypothetical protein